MKGFVPTPSKIVDLMVSGLFWRKPPTAASLVLDPGCGDGTFIEGILRWREKRNVPMPRIIGIESHPSRVREARAKFNSCRRVEIREEDFLAERNDEHFDFIIGNPPYVPITGLSEREKASYRRIFSTAQGRFDLYILFFERALERLKPNGRLIFITPEKFLYVETAAELRRLLAQVQVEQIHLVNEDTFGKLITYPTITSVRKALPTSLTLVRLRSGKTVALALPGDGRSWLPHINRDATDNSNRPTLENVCDRISCGVATGADSAFVRKEGAIERDITSFAFPTIAGRQLREENPDLISDLAMLIPYHRDGTLMDERELGPLRRYLLRPAVLEKLVSRTCVERKPWYAFHETPPLADILRPKILCKDITAQPRFWIDKSGRLVPRHSVYYIVPRDPNEIAELCAYLNSDIAHRWLTSHCQRAANGFLRLQSRILKQLPIPERFARARTCDRGRPRQLVLTAAEA
ncbi:MAG: TaqI-like C-terminal specificity domain-containing protein [Candidatus Binatus sp.]|uniref:Eco57I restriction-modification methylase domain-containing protein n=1 Tax=Candidatus Binatus sp. TaxID=2811406 RepID=UPI003C73E3CB